MAFSKSALLIVLSAAAALYSTDAFAPCAQLVSTFWWFFGHLEIVMDEGIGGASCTHEATYAIYYEHLRRTIDALSEPLEERGIRVVGPADQLLVIIQSDRPLHSHTLASICITPPKK